MKTETKKVFLAYSVLFDGYRGDVYQDVEVFGDFPGALEHVLEEAEKVSEGEGELAVDVLEPRPDLKFGFGGRKVAVEELRQGWKEGWKNLNFHLPGGHRMTVSKVEVK